MPPPIKGWGIMNCMIYFLIYRCLPILNSQYTRTFVAYKIKATFFLPSFLTNSCSHLARCNVLLSKWTLERQTNIGDNGVRGLIRDLVRRCDQEEPFVAKDKDGGPRRRPVSALFLYKCIRKRCTVGGAPCAEYCSVIRGFFRFLECIF